MKRKLKLILVLMAAQLAPIAHAELSNPLEMSSTTTTTSTWLDHFYINYFGTFHGAPLDNFSSPYTVSGSGNPSSSPINMDSELTTAYLITHNIGVGPDIPFRWVPVMGWNFVEGDLGIKAFVRNTILPGGANLYSNFYVQAPTSQYSQARHETFALKSTPALLYDIPRTRFTIGTWTEFKEYFGVTYDMTFKLYGEPYISYRLFKSLSLNLGYEMEAHHNVGVPPLAFSTYETDLQPGVIWNVTPKILVNPYFQIFTTNTVSYETMAVGAVVSATVF